MNRTRTGLVLAMVTLLALVAAPASAQDYPPTAPTVGVDNLTPQPGEAITVTGEGCPPGSAVTVRLVEADRTLGETTADDDGSFAIDVTIPTDLQAGEHTLRVECDGQTADVQIQIGAVATPTPTPAPEPDDPAPALAVTGMRSALGALLGIGLLGAGGGAVFAARRRHAKQQA